MSDKITYLTKENFEAELTAGRPIVIDFYADWCGPCQMLAPVYDEIADKYGDQVNFCKLNIDEQKKLAVSNQVLSIPTLLFIKDGREMERVTGAVTAAALEEKVKALL
ncbi:thioredoxin [Bacilliculturomica massiliensis]|uniref:thioredoxin n=1 Tax=Bacilliculturomica massiliensis TaxID=1917867 RepID=UPI0010321D24|nr:thioredoxin [Bacilliculturomica massiliensis]